MPSVELSKLQASAAPRALSSDDGAQLGAPSANVPASGGTRSGAEDVRGISIEIGTRAAAALEPSAPPVDRERVAEIRKALEEGRYPLVPTRIADAMIAAPVSFGMEK